MHYHILPLIKIYSFFLFVLAFQEKMNVPFLQPIKRVSDALPRTFSKRYHICMYVCICIYMVIPLSSPYLVVVGDDRVFGTREQMMLLQVVLVRLSYGAGIAWECYILCFQK